MVVHPRVEFKAIERHALFADGDGGQVRPNFMVKTVAIHSQIRWGIAKADQSWHDLPWPVDSGIRWRVG
jgi:hypothetical protein